MNGYDALALAVNLTVNGMDPNEATDVALETMEAVNSVPDGELLNAA